jgi:chromosome segregation ATPase
MQPDPQELDQLLGQLEEQLARMLQMKAALEQEAARERARSLELERCLLSLRERARAPGEEPIDASAASQEREELIEARRQHVSAAKELEIRLRALGVEWQRDRQELEVLRTARAHAGEELSVLTRQLERVLLLVQRAEARLRLANEERQQVEITTETVVRATARAAAERDELRAGLEASRADLGNSAAFKIPT